MKKVASSQDKREQGEEGCVKERTVVFREGDQVKDCKKNELCDVVRVCLFGEGRGEGDQVKASAQFRKQRAFARP